MALTVWVALIKVSKLVYLGILQWGNGCVWVTAQWFVSEFIVKCSVVWKWKGANGWRRKDVLCRVCSSGGSLCWEFGEKRNSLPSNLLGWQGWVGTVNYRPALLKRKLLLHNCLRALAWNFRWSLSKWRNSVYINTSVAEQNGLSCLKSDFWGMKGYVQDDTRLSFGWGFVRDLVFSRAPINRPWV